MNKDEIALDYKKELKKRISADYERRVKQWMAADPSQLIDAAAGKVVVSASHTGARVSGPIPLPTDMEVITILRAVHKYKDP